MKVSCALLTLFVLAACWGLQASALGQQEADMSVTPEREAAAMTFARRHHPELAALLEQLKDMDHKRYENAITDLFRTSERLAKLKDRLPERFESDLAIWKIDSRVRLLAARSAAGMDNQTRPEIKKLLIERNRIRASQLVADRDKLQTRLERINDSIADLQDNSEQLAERELDRLLKTVRSRTAAKNSAPKGSAAVKEEGGSTRSAKPKSNRAE